MLGRPQRKAVVDLKTWPNKTKLAQQVGTGLVDMHTKFGNEWSKGSNVKCVLARWARSVSVTVRTLSRKNCGQGVDTVAPPPCT